MRRTSLLTTFSCCWIAITSAAAGEPTVSERLAARSFPSVFQAWAPADNFRAEDELTTLARHDLVFHGAGFFGLEWNNRFEGLADGFTSGSMIEARKKRKKLLQKNPAIVMLAEIRYRDAARDFLPKDHAWWRRSADGKLEAGWEEGGYIQLDYSKAAFREHVAIQARAAVETGVVDGLLLDWWEDDEDRLALIKAVRKAIGDHALILVNANDRTFPRTAPFINGCFMECDHSDSAAEWAKIGASLLWAEKNLREPRINCLETWYHKSRDDLSLMRATTTLSLTHSNGMCLFSDPNPLPTGDHLHNWYQFWNKSLGKPLRPGALQKNGTWQRTFEKGIVVYNPLGNRSVTLDFPGIMKRHSTGKPARTHVLQECDGDIFLTES